jgi:hypothetical protein
MSVLLNEYKKIQFMVDSLVLPFIKNQHPKWRELILTYLEFLDENALNKSMNITDNVDVNSMYSELLDEFLALYFKDVVDINKFGLNDDNKRLFISLSKLIGNLKSTKTSFGFFFNSFSDFSIPSDTGDISVTDMTIELKEMPEWWLENNDPTQPFTYVFRTNTPELANLKELIKQVHPAGWLQLFMFEVSFDDESGQGEYMNGYDCFELDVTHGNFYNGQYNYDGIMTIDGVPLTQYYGYGYTYADDLNCAETPRFFASNSSTVWGLRSLWGSLWFSPILLPDTPFTSGGEQHGIVIDNEDNLYTHSSTLDRIWKLEGLTDIITDYIGYPIGYESGWSFQTMSWNPVTDRLVLVMNETGEDNVHWIELEGFTTTIALDLALEHRTMQGASLEDVRGVQLDVERNLLVASTVGYDGAYHNYLIIWDYTTGLLYEGGWHGRISSNHNAMTYSILDPDDSSSIWVVDNYSEDYSLRKYDYLAVVGTAYTPLLDEIDFNLRTLGKYGIALDIQGDMWMAGVQTISPYYNLVRRYHGISNVAFEGDPLPFSSNPAIGFSTVSDIDPGVQGSAEEHILMVYSEIGDGAIIGGDADWATARSVGTEAWQQTNNASGAGVGNVGSPYYVIGRTFYEFDLSFFDGVDRTITDISLDLVAFAYTEGAFQAYSTTWTGVTAEGDYNNYGSTPFFDTAQTMELWDGGWPARNVMSLNAAGLAYVATKYSGNLAFCLREYDHDALDTPPGDSENYRNGMYFKEEGYQDHQKYPRIILTYDKEPDWQRHTDDGYWTITNDADWDGDGRLYTSVSGSIELAPIGTWFIDERPIKVRITFSGHVGLAWIEMYNTDGYGELFSFGDRNEVTSMQEIYINNYGNFDLVSFHIFIDVGAELAHIEFLMP